MKIMPLLRFVVRDFFVSLVILLSVILALKGVEWLILDNVCSDGGASLCFPPSLMPSTQAFLMGARLFVMIAVPFTLMFMRLWFMLKHRRYETKKYALLSAVVVAAMLVGIEIPLTIYQNDLLTDEIHVMAADDAPLPYAETSKLWPHKLKMFFLTF